MKQNSHAVVIEKMRHQIFLRDEPPLLMRSRLQKLRVLPLPPKASDVASAEEGEVRSCNVDVIGASTQRILYTSRVFPNKTMLGFVYV